MEKIPTEQLRPEWKDRIPTPIEKMRTYLANAQIMLNERLKTMQPNVSEGMQLAVAPDFRIIPPGDLYGAEQRTYDNNKALEHYGTLDKEKIRKAEDNSAGTQFEILKTAIMHKHTGKRFIVVRSARYDDDKNGVDNILVDTESGQTVCAFDETSASYHGRALLEKTDKVLGKNFGVDLATDIKYGNAQKTGPEGVKLKYGIKLNEGRIECAEMEHLPIFLLALDYENLEEGQRTFVNGEARSRYETKLFEYFLTSLLQQIHILEINKRYATLPQELKNRVDSFKEYILEMIGKKKEGRSGIK